MKILVESLKRLYINKKVSEEKINKMVADKKITDAEKLYIIS